MESSVGCILVLMAVVFMAGDVESQFRDKNISINQEADAVQTLLARYLRRRLQATQLSTPPPPSVLFSSNHHRANVRQATRRQNDLPSTLEETEVRDKKEYQREEFDDDSDDLQGIEDSDRGRTRIDLLAGNSRKFSIYQQRFIHSE